MAGSVSGLGDQGRRGQHLRLGESQQAFEPADLTVKRKKYKMDLLPPGLVVTRYFSTGQAGVDRLRAEEEAAARELEEFVEEHSGEDGLLEGATTDAGKVTQTAVRARLKVVGNDPEGSDELDALEGWLELMKSLTTAKRTTKAAQTELDAKVLARYATLTVAHIGEIVVNDKWLASVEAGIGWVPWTIWALDEAYRKHHMFVRPKLRRLPSDYFRQCGFATFQEDKPGLDLARQHNLVDNFMWANDYPHHEGTWPHSAAAIERTMGQLTDAERAKILGLNAARVFRFPIPERYHQQEDVKAFLND
jgi:hypothetical protein